MASTINKLIPVAGTDILAEEIQANFEAAANDVEALQTSVATKQPLATVLTNTTASFTTAQESKLAGIATSATANSPDATLLARANHTGTQSADTLTDGTTNKAFLATERTKLAGIATGATANSADATLLARANHTGTQLASTISDFASTVRSTILTGLSLASSTAISATDTLLVALGSLQKQISDLVTTVAGKITASSTDTLTNKTISGSLNTISNIAQSSVTNLTTDLSNKQPLDAQLTDIAGLTPTDNAVIIGNGTNFVVESGATLKTSLGLTIGVDVQATLVSGTNIKTINGEAVLGSGNITITGGEPPYTAGLTNLTVSSIKKLKLQIAKAVRNNDYCVFSVIGDSTSAGYAGDLGSASKYTNSVSFYLYEELLRIGLPARYDFYSGGSALLMPDTNVVIGAGWSSFNGFIWNNPANLTSALQFTCRKNSNKADVYYFDDAGASGGILRLQFDAETAVDVALTGSATYKKATVTSGTSGIKTLKVFMNKGFFCAADIYDSNVKDIRICNWACNGGGIWQDSTAWRQMNVYPLLAASCYFINTGINQFGANNPTTYNTELGNAVTTLKAIGSVILEFPQPVNGTTETVQDNYLAVMQSIASTNGLTFINLHDRYGATYTAFAANGWAGDALHPNANEYNDLGRWKAKTLFNV